MKLKTSITLSEDILKSLDGLSEEFKNRSDLVETALRFFFEKRLQKQREAKDLKILNTRSDALNEEAEDVLSYQVEL